MDNLNKTVSFVLGLVVVLVFLAIITGRLNLKNKIPLFSGGVSPTPAVTKSPTSIPTPTGTTSGQNNTYGNYKMKQIPSVIPATGLPTFFLSLLFSGFGGGLFLRKTGKKK